MYDAHAMVDLEERCLNEWWLLEEIYRFAEDKIDALQDGFVYPRSGGDPDYKIAGSGNIEIGDWRPGFCNAAPNVILLTAVKILDAFVEWLLHENGQSVGYKFSDKLDALKTTPLIYPPPLSTRVWFRDRIVALYRELVPVRNTIIHNRTFQISHGGVEVNTGGNVNALTPGDLRSVAQVVVSLIRYVGQSWKLDEFRERRIKRAFDEIRHLHHEASLGQMPPVLVYVRKYVAEGETIDIDQIRLDVETRNRKRDPVFHLRLVFTDPSSPERAFLVPFEQLATSRLVCNSSALSRFASTVPALAES